ncbi:GGDEF domain-containing protein [Klebsiella pneumoniae subsp. pneumoniae]|nr:GGDEF domain-containing protein [Klebsiella pneumoniae subsp. pneumoniae]
MLYNIRLMLCIIHDITEEVHLKKELEFSRRHDPLTGLLNRREFHRLVEAPTFYPRGYCLLLIDIDHFKSINDIHGHQKGDEVLLVLSRILETSVDREDKIYRWGGEEFLLFFAPFADRPRADTGGGIRQAVSEYQTLSVTVSIGVAEHRRRRNGLINCFPASIKRCMRQKMTGVIG